MNDTPSPVKLLRILLVEDDDVDFMLIQKLLAASMAGEFVLERANTFESGFEQIALKRHDLYLFDYWLESGTGLDLLHEVNAHGSVAPVILLTRDDDHQIDRKAMQVGAADLLVKGKTMPLLLEHAIRYALERHRLIVELRALSLRDGLTGLYNRRGFTMLGELQLRLVRRFKREIGVFFADVDGLKGNQ